MKTENTAKQVTAPTGTLDIETIRTDFPILSREVRGKPLVYMDNAATSQKPAQVIEAIKRYYTGYNANIHRGVHTMSEEATAAYEAAREKARSFINARSAREIIFTRGATEAINLVAQSLGRSRFRKGDEILITTLEHHSNIVPWQLLCEQTGAVLKVAPINDRGELIIEEFETMLNDRTRMVAVAHISNALGTVYPLKTIIDKAHGVDALVLVDGAQAVPHTRCDVQDLDCDFYAFSSHKMFGPTGTGVLYGKQQLLETMPPYQGGGDMIKMVTFDKTEYNELPFRFEAGTPNIAGVIGMGAAIDYLNDTGMEAIAAYEHDLLVYGTEALQSVDGLRLVGTAADKASILSFVMQGIHPHDIGTILDNEGIAIRTGHHCAMPVMEFFNIPATARASLAFYNTRTEIDALVDGLHKVNRVFSG